jgi:hypothetical protein
MQIYTTSKIATSDQGIWMLGDFVSASELSSLGRASAKPIHHNVSVIDSHYDTYNPLELYRIGECSGVKITTEMGFEFQVSSNFLIKTGKDSTEMASSLESGDNILLSGNLPDSSAVIPIVIGNEHVATLTDKIAFICGLAFAYGRFNESTNDLVLFKVPEKVIYPEMIQSMSELGFIIFKSDNRYTIRIPSQIYISILESVVAARIQGRLPLALSKMRKDNIFPFLFPYIVKYMRGSSLRGASSSFLGSIQFLLFTRFGIVSKLNAASLSLEMFRTGDELIADLGLIAKEKQIMPDINKEVKDQFIKFNDMLYAFQDKIVSVSKVVGEGFEIKADQDYKNPIVAGLM